MLPSALIRDCVKASLAQSVGTLASTLLTRPWWAVATGVWQPQLVEMGVPWLKPTTSSLSLFTVLFTVNYLALIVIFRSITLRHYWS